MHLNLSKFCWQQCIWVSIGELGSNRLQQGYQLRQFTVMHYVWQEDTINVPKCMSRLSSFYDSCCQAA